MAAPSSAKNSIQEIPLRNKNRQLRRFMVATAGRVAFQARPLWGSDKKSAPQGNLESSPKARLAPAVYGALHNLDVPEEGDISSIEPAVISDDPAGNRLSGLSGTSVGCFRPEGRPYISLVFLTTPPKARWANRRVFPEVGLKNQPRGDGTGTTTDISSLADADEARRATGPSLFIYTPTLNISQSKRQPKGCQQTGNAARFTPPVQPVAISQFLTIL